MEKLARLCLAAPILLAGCMTATVIDDAQHPNAGDTAPAANYLLLPLTIPADIATSPFQLLAFISYCRGDGPRGPVTRLPDSYLTNQPSAKEMDKHD
jgi:hypothetical protein